MHKIITSIILLLFCTVNGLAQNPKWFKAARKTQITVLTYDAQNNIRQGQGYFIDDKGTALAEYDLFRGACKAVVIDSNGKEYEVKNIMGADALYNVIKLGTTANKTSYSATTEQNTEGKKANDSKAKEDNKDAEDKQTVCIMPICSTDKKALCTIDVISKVEQFGEAKHNYYTLSKPVDERLAGCPVYTDGGELIGSLQLAAKKDNPSYILAASYGKSLHISALDVNNSNLNAVNIPKALPDDESQATTYLFLMNRQNTEVYKQQIEAFIEKFPTSTVGYIQLAELQSSLQMYQDAEQTYTKAFACTSEKADELHHSFAKQLYQSGLKQTPPAEGWNMEHALAEASAAYAANPLPLYTALEGMCLYALQKYEESYEKFISMSTTNMRSAEYFLYASQCKQMLKASDEEILALQDSAIACYNKPYPVQAASYLYLRSKTLASMKRYREAVADMNEYEHLASGNISAQFCYEREQIEMQCRMYAQALSDIERAVKLEPTEPLFRAEEAVVNYRVGQTDQAIAAAKEAIRLDDKFADAHRILGICYRDKGNKAEARKCLERAIELGDSLSQGILDKMQ